MTVPVPDSVQGMLVDAFDTLDAHRGRAGGSTLVYQQRFIGGSGQDAFWLDGRPFDDDEAADAVEDITRFLIDVVDASFAETGQVVYAITLEVRGDGTRRCDLDTSTKLDGASHNDAGTYLDDLARRPRDGDQVPVWMRPVLARWGAWDPEAGRLTVDGQHRPNGTPVDMPDVEVDYWLPFGETPEGPCRAHGDGNVGPGHTVATPDELAAWRRANT